MLGSNQRPLPCESESLSFPNSHRGTHSAYIRHFYGECRSGCFPLSTPVVVKIVVKEKVLGLLDGPDDRDNLSLVSRY